MKIETNIRFALPNDVPQIINLCGLHAAYEKAAYNGTGKAKKLTTDLFGLNPKLHCLVAESDNEIIGYATYMLQYATWDVGQYMYMDCLFIKEFGRGLGIGEKLVRRIEMEGQKLGCSLVQWQTPDFNKRAIKFYKRIGAFSKNKQRFFLEIKR